MDLQDISLTFRNQTKRINILLHLLKRADMQKEQTSAGSLRWKANVDACIENIKALNSSFGKPVMICEIGLPVWEPQTDGVWKPASYAALGWNAYDKGAFKNGKATIILDPFKN